MICALALWVGAVAAENNLSLAKKAMLFEQDIARRFLFDGQVACKLHVPTAERPDVTYNMPDNAYMTGIYLGSLAMKYAVTKDPADRAAASASIRALHLLCTVSGKKGLLARAAWPLDKAFSDDGAWRESPDGKHKWRGDVSSDQMTGVIYGLAMAYDLAADDAHKKMIAVDMADLVGALLDNGLMIVDIDGKPTQFGKYMPGYVKTVEKMNALLLLQHLKVAAYVTGDARIEREYHRLASDEQYAETAVAARMMRRRVNFSDDVLLFLAYYPLIKHETDAALKELYLKSLRRTWEGEGKVPGAKAQGNPFYAFIIHDLLGDDSGVAAGIDTLKWFPLDLKWNQATIAAYKKEFGFTFNPAPTSPAPKPGEAVPMDRRQKTWSAWVQDPYAEAGERTADSPLEYNGHDYLAAYWLGRYLGLITPDM